MSAKASKSRWDDESLRAFYKAFHADGQAWDKISSACGKSADMCEALWKQHKSFLMIPSQPALEAAFVAMVDDHYNNIKEEPADEGAGAEPAANGSTGSAGNGAAAAAGSTKDGQTGVEDEAGQGAEEEPEEETAAAPAEGTGRPVRSTRGKPPRAHSPSDEDYRGRGAGTPGRANKNALASPASSKAKGGKFKEPESAKKRSRKLFNESEEAPLEEDEAEQNTAAGRKSPYRWKGKTQQRDIEQGADALLQLAMASSMDHHMGAGDDQMDHDGEPDKDAHGNEGADEDGAAGDDDMDRGGSPAFSLPAGTLERPGKRKVRPPARLNDDGFASPSKPSSAQVTPRRGRGTAGQNQGTPLRSPGRAATPRSGGGRASGRAKKQTRPQRILVGDELGELDEEGGEERGGDELTEDEDLMAVDEDAPASTRPNVERKAAATIRQVKATLQLQEQQMQMNSLMGADGQPFQLDQDTLAAMGMGGLPLPGLPNAVPGDMGYVPPGMDPMQPYMAPTGGRAYGSGGVVNGSQRRNRRKPLVHRPPPPDPNAQLQKQQQLMLQSMLGIGRFDGSLDAVQVPTVPTPTPERALEHFVSSAAARRWIVYEWFYSSLDRPFFMRCELSELLARLGLANLRKLTRGEWNLVRGAFGRPRRLSLNFLREERMKLEAYREHVRRKYEEAGIGAEVSPELPKPLRVGQEVTARHPSTRQLHDGVILTIKGSKYRVQFHRPELMTEVVQDTHVMPCDPRENLPAIMITTPLMLNGRSTAHAGGGHGPLARAKAKQPHMRAPPVLPPAPSMPTGMVPVGIGGPPLDTEADAALIAELSSKLEAKESLVLRLKEMNQQAEQQQQEHINPTEEFQTQYSQTIVQLKDINTALDALYLKLQSRSTAAALAMLTSSAGVGGTQGIPGGLLESLQNITGGGTAAQTQLGPLRALPPPITPADMAARTVVHAAYSDAKGLVQNFNATRLVNQAAQAALAGETHPPHKSEAEQAAENANAAALDRLILSCLTVLCTVQRSVSDNIGAPAVEASLDLAAKMVDATSKPGGGSEGGDARVSPNIGLYTQLMDSIQLLKSQLIKAT